MYLSERITADKITIATDQLGGMSEDGMRCRWAVTLHRPDGLTFSLPDPFEQNGTPTAFDVLDLVTGACNIIDQSPNWRDWQGEYMSVPPWSPVTADQWEERDRIYTEAMYQTWCEINERLCDFLGHQAHHDYLYEIDRSR